MSAQVILTDLFNVTSSLDSAAGATPCALPDGPRIDLFGRAVAPVSHSAQPVQAAVLPTSVTSGPPGSTSSASAGLTLSLVSRLKQRLTTAGSTLFNLTWREKVTPAGRLVYRLAASGRRTSDKDCGSWQTPKALDGVFSTPRTTGRPMHRATHLQTQTIALLSNADPTLASWPTPLTQDENQSRGMSHERHQAEIDRKGGHGALANIVTLTSWPTPNTMDTLPPMDYERRLNHPGRPGRTVSGNLREVVTLTSWPTPLLGDAHLSSSPQAAMRRIAEGKPTVSRIAALTSWPTPKVSDDNISRRSPESMERWRNRPNAGSELAEKAELASWPTASARDWRDTPGMSETGTNPDGSTRSRLDQLPRVAGLTAIGSLAATEKPGQLNPAHSRWLMGYPAEWDACAPTAMPSSRKSRKPS